MSLNVLARSQERLARQFAGIDGTPGGRFDGSEWSTGATGAPVLTSSLASFDCVVDEMFLGKTHAVLIGEVKDIHLRPFEAPLVYLDGTFTTVELFNERLWCSAG
jgi:flavin reductase (DIM6/NTAB) family NADH-FMN oxidoreductase RutF